MHCLIPPKIHSKDPARQLAEVRWWSCAEIPRDLRGTGNIFTDEIHGTLVASKGGDSQVKNRGRKLASLRAAIVTACVRSLAPSFSRMCFICAFTVSSEMKRRSAISRFRFPVVFPLLHPIATPITVS